MKCAVLQSPSMTRARLCLLMRTAFPLALCLFMLLTSCPLCMCLLYRAYDIPVQFQGCEHHWWAGRSWDGSRASGQIAISSEPQMHPSPARKKNFRVLSQVFLTLQHERQRRWKKLHFFRANLSLEYMNPKIKWSKYTNNPSYPGDSK